MNLLKAIPFATALCLAAIPAAGQGFAKDFETVRSVNPALDFSNAAGLSFLQKEDNVSEVVLNFEKGNGALTGIDGSSDCWKAGASTESFKRISDRMVFHGKLSYSHERDKDSGGPVLMDIRYNPLNFYESDPTTVGGRKIESYSLAGRIGYSLNGAWSIGLGTEYSTADRTKFKDPRFLNEWMDIDLSLGAMYKPSDDFSFGMALEFRHTLEQISAATYGTKDRDFYIYVDQGGFLGSMELFEGNSSYISTSDPRPMANDHYGASFQLVHGSAVRFYHQLRGFWRSGHFGSKASTAVLFSENSGPAAQYSLSAVARKADNIHRFGFSASWEMMSNYINSYSYKTEEGRSTVVVYHGQNLQLSRHDISASLNYIGRFGVSGIRPSLELGASLDGDARIQETTIYPNWRDHNVIRLDADIYGCKNFISCSNIFTARADVLFHTGFGTAALDGAYASSTNKLKSFSEYLNPQFEYDTASRAGARLSFTFTRMVSEKLSVYFTASDTFHALLQAPQYLSGSTRNIALVTVGCNF